jgi:hypothetical protein
MYPSKVYPEQKKVLKAKPPNKINFNQLKPKKTSSLDQGPSLEKSPPEPSAELIQTKKIKVDLK